MGSALCLVEAFPSLTVFLPVFTGFATSVWYKESETRKAYELNKLSTFTHSESHSGGSS
jgi:hypothetical protein